MHHVPLLTTLLKSPFSGHRHLVAVLALLLASLVPPLAASETADTTPVKKMQTLVWPDGTRYVGEVREGLRWGKGTIFWEDGTRFVGNFVAGQRQGSGTMILPDGTVYTGYFEDDQLVNPNETDNEPEPATTSDPTPPTPGVVKITDQVRSELIETLTSWASAWSSQDVDAYLRVYGESFQVPGRLTRRSWEAFRRTRIERPDRIQVSLTFSEFSVAAPNVVDVTVRQVYDSDRFSDNTIKVMRLQRVDGQWHIIRERSIDG